MVDVNDLKAKLEASEAEKAKYEKLIEDTNAMILQLSEKNRMAERAMLVYDGAVQAYKQALGLHVALEVPSPEAVVQEPIEPNPEAEDAKE